MRKEDEVKSHQFPLHSALVVLRGVNGYLCLE
jgi:hypothetical protein